MEVGRSSTVLLLLAALMLAASSTTAAAAVHRRQPPTAGSYQLITVETSRGRDKTKLAMRAGDSPIAGFANGKNEWFAIQGSEELMEPLRNTYGGGSHDIPGHGLVNLLGAMLKKNATS